MANRTGTSKNDKLTGTAASDRLFGLAGNDLLIGLGGNDTLDGSAGNDTLDGGAGNDRLVGGAGNDTYIVTATSGTDVFVEAAGAAGGTDTVRSSRASFTLGANLENLVLLAPAVTGIGNSLNNVITGNSLNNTLNGSTGNDTLNGGAGNDSLNGGVGNDSMAGGAGNDTYVVDIAGDKVFESGSGIDTVQSTVTFSLATHAQIENLTLTGTGAINGTGNSLANTITGNSLANTLNGAGGNDALNGGGGNDTLDGGSGIDQLTGGAGNDVYIITDEADDVNEAASGGTDTVRSSLSAYTLGQEVENLVITAAGEASGTGNEEDNVITGGTGENLLQGLEGNDTLTGGGSPDVLEGGADDDVLAWDDQDILHGGEGTDLIRLTGNTELLVNDDSFYSDMEGFDLAGTNTLHLAVGGILGFGTGLRVDGGSGDIVSVEDDWVLAEAPETINGALYDIWTRNMMTLKIEQGIDFQDTNHVPEILMFDDVGAVTDTPMPGNLTDTGQITFDDLDLHDGHTVSAMADSNPLGGSLEAEITVAATGEATGTIGWTYTVDSDSTAVEALAQGETATETFTISVFDDIGAMDNQTITITVTGVNDAPGITEPGAQMGLEGADIAIAGLAVTDDNEGDIEVTLQADEGAITVGAIMGLDITGSGSSTVTLTGTVAEINAALSAMGGVLYNSGNFLVTDTFTVTADDGVAGPVSDSFDIVLIPVNDAPSGADATVVVPESGTYTFVTGDFGFTDLLDGHSLGAVVIGTLPGSGEVWLNFIPVAMGAVISAADIADGDLTFVQTSVGEGTDDTSFTFQVRDNGDTLNGGVNTDPTPNTMTVNQLEFLGTAMGDTYTATSASRIVGQGGNDTFTGGVNSDEINGGGDNDLISGAGGNDVLIGGEGNDTLTGGAGADPIVAGNGTDVVIYSSAADGAAAGANTGYDIVQQFTSLTDDIRFESTLGDALDDGAMSADDGFLTMQVGAEADFRGTSSIEAMLYTSGVTDMQLVSGGFTNVLALINGLGVLSANGDDGLFIVRGDTTTGLYYYVEATGGGDGFEGGADVSAGELSLLAIVNTALAPGDFTTDQ